MNHLREMQAEDIRPVFDVIESQDEDDAEDAKLPDEAVVESKNGWSKKEKSRQGDTEEEEGSTVEADERNERFH